MDSSMYLPFEIVGTIAFAVSGALVGIKKKMDIFGVAMLGVITAVGGGVVRDLILGITPPKTFQDPIYAAVALLSSVVVFLPWVRRKINNHSAFYESFMLWMDSVGLGVFTVVGVKSAYAISAEYNLFLLVFVGTVTGVGGGVMRDMMAGETPQIFIRHFYACASLIGAVLCSACWKHLGGGAAMLLGAVAVVALRICAAYFKWNLPRAGE